MQQKETLPKIDVDIELYNYYDAVKIHSDRIATFMSEDLAMRSKDITATTLNFSDKQPEENELFYKPATRTLTLPINYLGISSVVKDLSIHLMDDAKREEAGMLFSQQFSIATALSLATVAHYEKVRRTCRKIEVASYLGTALLGFGVAASHDWYALPVVPAPGLLANMVTKPLRNNGYQIFNAKNAPLPQQDLISLFLRKC